jgi:DNA-directed RNA polymerase subunit omega
MDRISDKVDSKFRFVLLAAHRAEQLMRGAHARVTLKSPKVARIAMPELFEDRVTWGYGPAVEEEGETGSEASEGSRSDVH